MSKRSQILPEPPSKRPKIDSTKYPCDTNSTITNKNVQKENLPWPEADILTLLDKIAKNIPTNDNLSYSTRLESFNWDQVTFKAWTASECKEIWQQVSKKVRKFRLLEEIITDVKNLVSNSNKQILSHPSKPKQPPNSYMLFIEEKRQQVVNDNPNLSMPNVARKLGEMFRSLSKEQKLKYVKKAQKAKEEYLEKMKIFYGEHPEMIPKPSPNKKKKKPVIELEPGQGPPAKPKTPFELFAKIESEKEDTPISRNILRQRWNDLPDTSKCFWINWAEEQCEKYQEELKEYLKNHRNYEPEKINRPIISKKDKEIKDRCSGKPDKPPPGAYHLFSKMMLESEQVQNINKKELMNYISEKWKACTDDEKNEYKTRLEQMWEEHQRKLEVYLKTILPEDRDRVREECSRRKSTSKISEDKNTPKREETKIRVSKPVPPPRKPYKFFLTIYKGKRDPLEVWKLMTKQEKKVINKKLKEELRVYLEKFTVYLKSLSREEIQKLGEASTLDNQESSSSECDSTCDEEEEEENGEEEEED